jgi:outer membrane murein-binding lipoprotein Lpp
MADGIRLSQLWKQIDFVGSQVREIAEVKSQVEDLRSQMMALTTSVNTIASNVSTLIKDNATSSEHGETHKDKYAEFPRERRHYNEEEYHGGC